MSNPEQDAEDVPEDGHDAVQQTEAIPPPDPEAAAHVRRFRLVTTAGPDAGAACTIDRARAVIGTHETADLVLKDRSVSRFHCEIRLEQGRPVIRDLGSRNGLVVDGVAVLEAPLRHGAILTLGRSAVRFDLGEDQVKLPLSDRHSFGLMVGESPAMRAVFAVLERAAGSDATVLLEGETGTGKEVAAESIHRESSRRDGPFIIVDCGAIPPDLLESELFGHERGAFTGAVTSREGAFEAASGGTIFLDEIGELSPELQPKILRVLERREIKRVGSTRYAPVDVRVVAATNRNLRADVNARRFRSDLYYRLAVVEVRLPPLRERPEDLPKLVEKILASLGASRSAEADLLRTPSFIAQLRRHAWPGNVREVRNYLERCLALQEQTPIEPEGGASSAGHTAALGALDLSVPFKTSRDRWTRAFERQYLEGILRQHENNVTAAARASGLDRIYFYRLLWRHGLRSKA